MEPERVQLSNHWSGIRSGPELASGRSQDPDRQAKENHDQENDPNPDISSTLILVVLFGRDFTLTNRTDTGFFIDFVKTVGTILQEHSF